MKIIENQVFPIALSHFPTTKYSKKILTYFRNIFTLGEKWYPHAEQNINPKNQLFMVIKSLIFFDYIEPFRGFFSSRI